MSASLDVDVDADKAASYHPVVVLGDRLGREQAATLVGLVLVAIIVAIPDDSPAGVLALLVTCVLFVSAAWISQRRDEPDTDLGRARLAYVEGNITLAEFERRLEVLLDEQAQEIREVVEEIEGIGPETSAPLARRFDSIEDLATSTREEIEEIHGVGESTSGAIVDALGGDRR